MRHFLVTQAQAQRLPRWALLGLCALYVLPGWLWRDPWGSDDAAGFGVALTMARGAWSDWLMPSLAGLPVREEGPLPFVLMAAAIRASAGWADPFVAARAVAIAGLALLFAALWQASYRLASRPGLMPTDPFGVSAHRVDFGRAIADSALLLLLATFGLVARLHETTAEAAQVAWIAVFLWGMARALDRPLTGGLIAGLAIAASAATRGLPLAAALLLVALVLPLLARPYRWVAFPMLVGCVPLALAGALAWPWLLTQAGDAGLAHLNGWLAWNAATVGLPDAESLTTQLRTLPWFFWPAWPVAAWALARWRSRLAEPALLLPLATLGATLAVALALPATSGRQLENVLMPAAPPMAMLAAVGLPTLRRSLVALIDWFAVITFSLVGLAAWAYWIAYLTGTPPRMAASVARLAPDFSPPWVVPALLLGLAASVGWLLLVRWRISRRPPYLWRSMVLASGGLVLAWSLLMTLWLPLLDERNTYRDLAARIARVVPQDHRCVTPDRLGVGERAALFHHARLRFDAPAPCDWMLAQDRGPLARTRIDPPPGWVLRWEGRRRATGDERFRLYERRR